MVVYENGQVNNDILQELFKTHSAAIFDMDGTLLDSMTLWSNVDALFFEKHNCIIDKDFQEYVSTMTLDEAAVYMCKHYELSITPKQVKQEFIDILADFYCNRLPLKDGALELLEHLYEQGVKIIIATANEYDISYAAMVRTGVMKYAEGLVTCTMVNASKDTPAVYMYACEKLDKKVEECIVFEDSYHAVKTASEGGFDVVAVYDEAAKNKWDAICSMSKCQVVF